MARNKNWPEILRLWDKFLKLNPDNSEAYFERSGTFYHYGDHESMLKDLKKAASLGHHQAKERLQMILLQAKNNLSE